MLHAWQEHAVSVSHKLSFMEICLVDKQNCEHSLTCGPELCQWQGIVMQLYDKS